MESEIGNIGKVILYRTDTGGASEGPNRPINEGLIFERQEVSIHNPFVPESVEKPKQADVEALIWNKDKEGVEGTEVTKKMQYVVMGGFAINAVEVHTILSALMNHADTVVGVAHMSSPQTKLDPPETPFNDELSFANSGYAVLRVIENLIQKGKLDNSQPITVVGYSSGCTPLIEAISQDIQESEKTGRQRYIQSGVFYAPAGILEMGGYEKMAAGTAASMGPYWKEYLDHLRNDIVWHLKDRLRGVLDNKIKGQTAKRQDISPVEKSRKEVSPDLDKNPRWQLPTWQAVRGQHDLFEKIEIMARNLPFVELLAHFHRSWIDQGRYGWPHLTPQTNAVKRDTQNIGHNVTEKARASIKDTPILFELMRNDGAVPPDKFLSDEDWQVINEKPKTEQEEIKLDLIIKRAKEKFPLNGDNVKVLISVGERAHHLAPRSSPEIYESHILRYLQPELDKFV